MKNYVGIIKLFAVFLLVISCETDDHKDLNLSVKSHEFYDNYFRTEMLKNGVVETEFFKIPKLHFDQPWMDGATHAEFISNLDETVALLKKVREKTLKKQIQDVNDFVKIIKENNLVEKEKFYQDLISAKSDIDRLILYQKEYKKYIDSCDEDKTVIIDPGKPLKSDSKYDYLFVVAKNSEGVYVAGNAPYNKKDLQYSIKKYDKEFQKDGYNKYKR